MSAAPFLVTERLELWQPQAEDRDELHALVTEAGREGHLGAPPDRVEFFSRFLRGSGSWQLYGYGLFLLRLRGQKEIVGNCGVFHSFRGLGEDFDDAPEAGWIVAGAHTGQGLAGEAMRAVLGWFDAAHGPRRLVAMIAPANTPSLRLAASLGFNPMRQAQLADGDAVQLFERVA